MEEYIRQKGIKTKKIKKRKYQINIFNEIKDKNSIVVLPTGLGKTIIAILVLNYKLRADRKTIFLAPTKPLCEQHALSLKKFLNIDNKEIILVTGETFIPKKRKEIYEKAKVIVATPQTIMHDMKRFLSLKNYGLIIFDEVHRSVGDYAYVKIGKKYQHIYKSQILGLTASPGSNFEKLKEVAIHLDIKHVEVRDEWDKDVRPYLSKRILDWQLIQMPEEIKEINSKVESLLITILNNLKKYSSQAKNLTPNKLSVRALVEIQKRMQKNLGIRGGSLYHGLSLVSAAIKLSHLKDMITSQGLEVAKAYISKLEKDNSKAANKIKKEQLFLEIKNQIIDLQNIHPKLDETKKIILEHVEKNKNPRIMIFAEYRDTVEMLIKELNKIDEIKTVRFIGQTRNPSEKGMSQKEQKQTLDDFRKGIYNTLISTSIGEEGIDIPIINLVLFYEPVPSAIRHIQRKGRTARDGLPGEVKILIMENSRDEAYYWTSVKKEKKMYKHVYRLKKLIDIKNEGKILLNRQTKIFEYL